jgi:hypothetical protein
MKIYPDIRRVAALTVGLFSLVFVSAASAGIHTWRFSEAFSNADGSIQFVELVDQGTGGFETGVGGGTLSSTLQTYILAEGAVAAPTNGRHYLIATQSFADLPGAPVPDAIIPLSNIPFFSAAADVLGFSVSPGLTVTGAPTNGTDSVHVSYSGLVAVGQSVAVNSPTNYAGATGSVNASPGLSGPARILSMSGQWFQNRGPLVDIPNNGGAGACAAFIGQPRPAPASVSDGCVNNFIPQNGGIPAAAQAISVTGGSPANFSIVNNAAFGQVGGTANRATVPVVGIPTVIQLASQFSLQGPALTTVLNGGGPASFQANAWSNDPGQAARVGANFTWCPPGGACTGGTGTTFGALGAQIKYTGGANAFGGTMGMMLRNTAVVSIRLENTLATMTPRVLHQLVGGTTNPTYSPQMGGGGYANHRLITLLPGPIHNSYSVGLPCTTGFGQVPAPAGCGVITAQGPFLFSAPGSMNEDWGMPWTTGTVLVQNIAGNPGDGATTFSVHGSDSRSGAGAGQITMVAGATTERTPSSNHFAALEVVTMTFAPAATPALSAPAILALVSLMVLAGGYMVRRRFVPTH